MQTHKFVGIGLMGLFLVGIVFPAHIVSASSEWAQSSVSDFNSDTMTNLEIHQLSPSDNLDAFVHIADNQTQTISETTNPDANWSISSANLHTLACAFTPSFNGIVDEIDFKIFHYGTPVDSFGNKATLTIGLYSTNDNSPYAPVNLIKDHTYSQDPWIPAQNNSWTPLYLTESDSIDNSVIQTTHYYTIKVSSNAVADSNNEYRWQYNQNQNNPDITTSQKNGGIWQIWGGGTPIDPNIKINIHTFKHTGNLVSVVYNTGKASAFTWFDADDRSYKNSAPIYYVRDGNSPTPDQSWCAWTQQTNNAQWAGAPNDQYVQYKFVITATNDPLQTDAFTGAVRSVHITYI